MERRAAPAAAVGPNPAAVRFEDRLADCQAHAAALLLRRKERAEYLVGFARGQPGPYVMNGNFNLAVLTQLRRKYPACLPHRLDAMPPEISTS